MTTESSMAQPPRKSRVWIWPAIVVGLLALQVGLSLAGAFLATRGQSFAVEDDYYNKALHWDDFAALQQRSAALGWKADLVIGNVASALGRRSVALHLQDRNGQNIDHANVQMICFHHARANDFQDVTLKAAQPGVYVADLPLNRAGTWEFRLSVTRGHDQFIEKIERELPAMEVADGNLKAPVRQ